MRLCCKHAGFEREAEVIEGEGVGLAESSEGWMPKFGRIPSFPVGGRRYE